MLEDQEHLITVKYIIFCEDKRESNKYPTLNQNNVLRISRIVLILFSNNGTNFLELYYICNSLQDLEVSFWNPKLKLTLVYQKILLHAVIPDASIIFRFSNFPPLWR
jgi:hypothetical protein